MLVRAKGRKVHALDQDFIPEDSFWSVLNSFNQNYGFIFRYMVREVGPVKAISSGMEAGAGRQQTFGGMRR